MRKRVFITISVELDPTFGAFSTPEDAARRITNYLTNSIPHYNPRLEGYHTNQNPTQTTDKDKP